MTNNKTEGVEEASLNFLPFLIENYEAAKQGYKKYHDDPLDKIKYKAIADEYEDLIAIYRNRQPITPPSPPAGVEQRAKGEIWVKAEERRPGIISGHSYRYICRSVANPTEVKYLKGEDIPVYYEWLDETQSIAGSESQGQELEQLRAWKAEAMIIMADLQEIGKELGIKWGHSIHDKILPAIKNMKAEIDRFKNPTSPK